MSMTGTINRWGLSEQRIDELMEMLKAFRLEESLINWQFYLLSVPAMVALIFFVFLNAHIIYFFYKNPDINFSELLIEIGKIHYEIFLYTVMYFFSCFVIFMNLNSTPFNTHPDCNNAAVKSIDGIYISSRTISARREGSKYAFVYIYDQSRNSVIRVVLRNDNNNYYVMKEMAKTPYFIGTPVKATYYEYTSGVLPFTAEYYRKNYAIEFTMNGVQLSECADHQSRLARMNQHDNKSLIGVFFYFVLSGMFIYAMCRKTILDKKSAHSKLIGK